MMTRHLLQLVTIRYGGITGRLFNPFCQPPNKYTSSPNIDLLPDYLLSKRLDKYKSCGLMKIELKNKFIGAILFKLDVYFNFISLASPWEILTTSSLETYMTAGQVSISVNV